MRNSILLIAIISTGFLISCQSRTASVIDERISDETFFVSIDSFAQERILRYYADGFDSLSLKQKLLVYYLVQASLCTRDIIYDQNYRYNLQIRHLLEQLAKLYPGDKTTDDWLKFELYLKQIWYNNGIHDTHSGEKIIPHFTKTYFNKLLSECGKKVSDQLIELIFNPDIDAVITNDDPSADKIRSSAVNFYDSDLTEADIESYYKSNRSATHNNNGKLMLNQDGSVTEYLWKSDGMYGPAIKQIILQLNKAREFAESPEQAQAITLLIEYFESADPQKLMKYKELQSKLSHNRVGFNISFDDTSKDPLHIKGVIESIVFIRDKKAEMRLKSLADSLFSSKNFTAILDTAFINRQQTNLHVAQLINTGGNNAPAWNNHRMPDYFTNINKAINYYERKKITGEFAPSAEVYSAYIKYSYEAQKAFHQIREMFFPSIKVTNTEERQTSIILNNAIADLQALCLVLDPAIIKYRLLSNKESAQLCYDQYINKALLLQLAACEPGKDLSDPVYRARQLVASIALERGQKQNCISKEKINGKTYFKINNYSCLRKIFLQILKEIRTVVNEEALQQAKNLIEKYGTVADQLLLSEVKSRIERLNIPVHSGFVQPELELMTDKYGNVTDVKISYPMDFSKQMFMYSEKYSFLPESN